MEAVAESAAAGPVTVGLEMCDACGGGDSVGGNEILLCDGLGCGKNYHQKCVIPHVLKVPEGVWLCTSCSESGNEVDPEALEQYAREAAAKAAEAEVRRKLLGNDGGKGFDNRGGNMLMCNGCLDRCHVQCLEKDLEKQRERWASWRCLGCKLCESCGQDGTKARLAICDVCESRGGN